FDAAVSTTHFDEFWKGDGLGTQDRPLDAFDAIIATVSGVSAAPAPSTAPPASAPPATSGKSWTEFLTEGFDPAKSIWGALGKDSYLYNRATETMRNLSREQVNQLMASCKNEAELNALRMTMVGGPAVGYAHDWLLANKFNGDMNRFNNFSNYWNHINPASAPRFDAVTGRFNYQDSRWDFDAAVSTTHFDEFWKGDGLGTQDRPLAGFDAIIAASIS
ncbi:MAG: hypothetical protein ACAI38_05550, partial [Myxococcota bacterium]